MIAAILGWTKLPQWALELIALALVGGAVWYSYHYVYENGVADEVARVKAQAAKDTIALQEKANTAEHSHDNEILALQQYRTSHPEQPVRLCISHPVRPASPTQPRAESPAAGAAVVQPVPGGDSGVRADGDSPDISGMLSALAASSDTTLATARECEARIKP